MVEAKTYKSAKRFGSRYGRRVRQKFAELEESARKKHKCPYCNRFKAKRLSPGIWFCKNCNAKFTGRAYGLAKKIIIREEVTKQEREKPEEKREEDQRKERFKNKAEKEEKEK